MACINMFSPEHQGRPISPRISFSSDFAVEAPKDERPPVAPPNPDFEFAVGGRPMMAADELFFKGRLLPLHENCVAPQLQRVTLRDELLSGEDEEDDEWDAAWPSSRPLRGRWKGLLGLRKTSCATKKHDNGEGVRDRAATLMEDDAVVHAARPTQGLRVQGGARPGETEFRL